jgi:hypothetical protein
VKVSVRSSRIVQNNDFGVVAESMAGAPVSLTVSDNIISGSIWGVGSYRPGSKVWVAGNTISGTNAGLINNYIGGILETAGNNAMRNNINDVSPSGAGPVTLVSPQ